MKRLLLLSFALLLFACMPTPEAAVVTGKADGESRERIAVTPAPAYATLPPEIPAKDADAVEAEAKATQTAEAVGTDAAPDAKVEAVESASSPSPASEPLPSPAPEAATLFETLGAPERVRDSFSGKAIGDVLTVEIDAAVDVPNAARVPVLSVRLRSRAGEAVETLFSELLGPGPYCMPLEYQARMRPVLETQMRLNADYIDALSAMPYGPGTNYGQFHARLERRIASEAEELAALPAPAWTETAPVFGAEATARMTRDYRYFGWVLRPAEGVCDLQYIDYGRAPDTWSAAAATVRAPKTDAERAAIDAAEAFSDRLGWGAARADGVAAYDEDQRLLWNSETGFDCGVYYVSLVPYYEGIPAYRYRSYFGSDTGKQAAGANADYAPPLEPEAIFVTVRDGEVVCFEWQNAIEPVAVENENVPLLPFDRILEIFRRQIFYGVYLDKGCPETMRVTAIRLSYMRVRRPDSDADRLLPVWDFLGYCVSDPGDEAPLAKSWYRNLSFLTVNAIDGSVIDRNKGY